MKVERIKDMSLVEKTLLEEFKTLPPSEQQGAIFGIVEDGEVKAFLLAEQLVRIGLIWVKPEERTTKKSFSYLRRMFDFLVQYTPNDTSLVGFDCTGEYKKLLEKFGFRPIRGDIYRLDV